MVDISINAPSTHNETESTYRRNFGFFLTDGILFTVAMSLLGTSTLIPDFVRKLTNSEVLIGLSATLFEIGFTLPQLFIARYIVGAEHKKWWFVGPNIPVRFVMLLFALLTVWLGAAQPFAILIAFFICYGVASFGDGLVGVPWVDLVGTSLNDKWRARLFGLMNAISGLIMIALAPLIALALGASGLAFPNNYALIFGAAGILFAISILPVLFVKELPGGKAVEKLPAFSEYLPSLGRVLREDAPFRGIIVLRVFTILFTMASPFYIGFATGTLGLSSEEAVPTLLTMQTLGGILGAFAYARFGEQHNLRFIQFALAAISLLPITALVSGIVGAAPLYFGFLIAGFCLSNLSFAYQNWLIGYANHDQRPTYAGLYNTLTALFSLIAPFIAGTIAQSFGYEPLFVIAIVMIFAALFVSIRYLPDPQRKQKEV